jgi:peptidoglycan/xylan/chitin deacetylase (PgdA/CDA1 family)
MMPSGAVIYGAHTRTHVTLPQAAPERLNDEVAGSRVDLERGLETSIDTFSYPYGEHDARSVAAVEHTRFAGACTVRPGLNSAATSCFKLHRIEIYGTDSLLRFICGLWAGDMEALWRRKHR